jgi:hypothetical protein
MENERHNRETAPEDLIRAFKELKPKEIRIPESVDSVVLDAARRRFVRPDTVHVPQVRWWDVFRLWPHWARAPLLAAAGLLVALFAFFLVPENPQFAREDVNRDGRVDVLDAFQLARDVRSGVSLPLELDFNGDGVVSPADAEAVASVAVRLSEEERRL